MAKDDLGYLILLLLPLEYWNCRCKPPHLAYEMLGIKLKALCILRKHPPKHGVHYTRHYTNWATSPDLNCYSLAACVCSRLLSAHSHFPSFEMMPKPLYVLNKGFLNEWTCSSTYMSFFIMCPDSKKTNKKNILQHVFNMFSFRKQAHQMNSFFNFGFLRQASLCSSGCPGTQPVD